MLRTILDYIKTKFRKPFSELYVKPLDKSKYHVVLEGVDCRMGVSHWCQLQGDIVLDEWPDWEPVIGKFPADGNPFDYDWWQCYTVSGLKAKFELFRRKYGDTLEEQRLQVDPSCWRMLGLGIDY